MNPTPPWRGSSLGPGEDEGNGGRTARLARPPHVLLVLFLSSCSSGVPFAYSSSSASPASVYSSQLSPSPLPFPLCILTQEISPSSHVLNATDMLANFQIGIFSLTSPLSSISGHLTANQSHYFHVPEVSLMRCAQNGTLYIRPNQQLHSCFSILINSTSLCLVIQNRCPGISLDSYLP